MSAAPPPFRPGPSSSVDALLDELRALETPELLALCLRFRREVGRLGTYLSILRRRPGSRAQFAACLVCYDMARLGHETAQREFLVLTPTMLELSRDSRLVEDLLHGDPYLVPVWEECRKAISTSDPREEFTVGRPAAAEEYVGEIELLQDADLPELGSFVDARGPQAEQQKAQFIAQLRLHFDFEPDRDESQPGRGLQTDTREDVEQLALLLAHASSVGSHVSVAQGLASLGNLFLGTHLRRHTLFGRPNPHRITTLREGLQWFVKGGQGLAEAAALFEQEGGDVRLRFEKVIELMLDYVAYCGQERLDPLAERSVEAYLVADRQPPLLAPIPPLETFKRRR